MRASRRVRVGLVPYAHDPAPLIEGRLAGLVDFVVDPQYRLARAGVPSHAILLFDHGAPLPNNVAVVSQDTYRSRRDDLVSWLLASRRGWEKNYRGTTVYPARLRGAPLVESRTLEHEIYANAAFRPMVESTLGILSLNDGLITGICRYLERNGLYLDPSVFVPLA